MGMRAFWGGDGRYVHHLDCGDTFMGIYRCQNLSNIQFKYMQSIICQLYFHKAIF